MNFHEFLDHFSKYLLQASLTALEGEEKQAAEKISRASDLSAEEKRKSLAELQSNNAAKERVKKKNELGDKIKTGVSDDEKIALLKAWIARDEGNVRRMFDKKSSEAALAFIDQFVTPSTIQGIANKAEIKNMNINDKDSLRKAFSEMDKPLENDITWKEFWKNRESPEDKILQQKILYGYRFRMITSVRKIEEDVITAERTQTDKQVKDLTAEIQNLRLTSSNLKKTIENLRSQAASTRTVKKAIEDNKKMLQESEKTIESKEKLLKQAKKELSENFSNVGLQVSERAKETGQIQKFHGQYLESKITGLGLQTKSSEKRKENISGLQNFGKTLSNKLGTYLKKEAEYIATLKREIKGQLVFQYKDIDSQSTGLRRQVRRLKAAIDLFNESLSGEKSENDLLSAKRQLAETVEKIYTDLRDNQPIVNRTDLQNTKYQTGVEDLKQDIEKILTEINMADRIASLKSPPPQTPAPGKLKNK